MIGIVVVSRGGTVIGLGWGMKCIFTVVISDGVKRRISGSGGGGGGGHHSNIYGSSIISSGGGGC